MRYKQFRIRNFKGIKDATVDLTSQTSANVFALVGLNESGKTTVLEAVHSYSPDYRTKQIVGDSAADETYESIVPRHEFSTFTGSISVEATIILDEQDKRAISKSNTFGKFVLDPQEIPDEVKTSLEVEFRRGDFVRRYRTVSGRWKARSPKGKIWKDISSEERESLASRIYIRSPDIAYYPTFIFDFPEKIWLSARGSKVVSSTNRCFQISSLLEVRIIVLSATFCNESEIRSLHFPF